MITFYDHDQCEEYTLKEIVNYVDSYLDAVGSENIFDDNVFEEWKYINRNSAEDVHWFIENLILWENVELIQK